MLRWPTVQIIGLIVVLMVVSFLPVPVVSVVLEPVRLLLLMVLGVACVYLGLLLRDQPTGAEPIWVEADRERAR